MENVEEVRDLALGLQDSVKELEVALLPLVGESLDELIKKCKLPKEEAEFLTNYLYCTVSIVFAYLKALGVNTDGHPIMRELDRVKASMKKLKDLDTADQKAEDTDTKSKEEAAQYIQRTLGGASGGAAASNSMKSPAISASNFQGKHTKFKDEDNDDSDEELQQKPVEGTLKKETTESIAPRSNAPTGPKVTENQNKKEAPRPKGRNQPKGNPKGQSKNQQKNNQGKVSKPQPQRKKGKAGKK